MYLYSICVRCPPLLFAQSRNILQNVNEFKGSNSITLWNKIVLNINVENDN